MPKEGPGAGDVFKALKNIRAFLCSTIGDLVLYHQILADHFLALFTGVQMLSVMSLLPFLYLNLKVTTVQNLRALSKIIYGMLKNPLSVVPLFPIYAPIDYTGG